MQKLSALKTITDIVFFTCMTVVIFGIPFIIMYAVMPDRIPFDLKVTGENFERAPRTGKILLFILAYIVFLMDVYALSIFREILGLFKKKIFFSDRISSGFNLIGRLTITSYFTFIIGETILGFFTVQEVKVSINFTILYVLGGGYFFIVLGSIFKMAKKHKEENDLTI